jgi:hypothetical protein
VINEGLLVLLKNGQPVLSAILQNINFFEIAEVGKI